VMSSKVGFLLLFLMLGILPCAMAQTSGAALPYPTPATPAATDLGELKALSATTPISVTLALTMRDPSGAEKLLVALHTPGNPQFHKFLSVDEFTARFAPSDADVANVVAVLGTFGLKTERASATTLHATGLPADMERAFSVSLHGYAVPAHDSVTGYNYHAPVGRVTIPADIASSVVAVFGLDSRPTFRPRHLSAVNGPIRPQAAPSVGGGTNFGTLTVLDFAHQYDVQPLYTAGVNGTGSTLAIVTLAAFTPSDAFAYWAALGLTVNAGRITVVNVDGGPGAPSDASGSSETTLDVEQSGGIAPGANIIVYQAPNTNQGFLDAFAAAVTANTAQTISTSWGFWEWFNNLANAPVTDPMSGLTVSDLQATHEQLLQAGIQGQTWFAAAGDGGAYDVNHDLNCFPISSVPCTNVVSADYPASDPAITAAGGTTLPGPQVFCLNMACTQTLTINVANERVWGWDYLRPLCDALGIHNTIKCGIFAVGGGGAVSVFWSVPSYQNGLTGVLLSPPGQSFIQGGIDFFDLPAGFAGRNVPDLSFNADPDTGYDIFYTSSSFGFGVLTFFGGTSFVAPQLNGVSALLYQYVGGKRIGLLNFPVYQMLASGQAYKKPHAPIHAIGYGNNWFYNGTNGYNPAAGAGTMDVWNFAQALKGMLP
jgi:kumamolisin